MSSSGINGFAPLGRVRRLMSLIPSNKITHFTPGRVSTYFALTARLVYEIEYRFDIRRKLLGGELPQLAIESDGPSCSTYTGFRLISGILASNPFRLTAPFPNSVSFAPLATTSFT